MLIALWYKNYNSLLGKRASVMWSSFLSVRCPKFQLGKDWIVNKRLQKTFRRAVPIPSHLFFWAGVLVTWSVQHRSGSLNYTCSSCHTWIGILEYWMENAECSGWNEWLLTSWSYLLTINTYTLQEKTSLPFPPFLWPESPYNAHLHALSMGPRESPLKYFIFFPILSKSQPWCFCNPTLAVVLCLWDKLHKGANFSSMKIQFPQCPLAAGGVVTLHSSWDDLLTTFKNIYQHLVQRLAWNCRFLCTLSHLILISTQGCRHDNIPILRMGVRVLSSKEIGWLGHMDT